MDKPPQLKQDQAGTAQWKAVILRVCDHVKGKWAWLARCWRARSTGQTQVPMPVLCPAKLQSWRARTNPR